MPPPISETGKTMAEREIIPADLYEEFLYLLPSKDLVNFKRVCKDWNELISSQRFIQKHLERSKADCNGTLIAALSSSGIIVYDDATGNQIRRTIAYPSGFSSSNTEISGSCDGLVCLVRTNSKEFALINPSTGKFHVRTTDGYIFKPRRHSFWFGQHPSTGEYLIIAIQCLIIAIQSLIIETEMLSQMIWVYELSSKLLSSQDFSIPPIVYPVYTRPILFHGALHWPGYITIQDDRRVVVLTYDIEKKKLVENLTPFEFEPSIDVRLGIVDGCMFATVHTWWESKFELWIMKEYGVEESWTKCYSTDEFEKCGDLCPLGFLPDGALVLDVGNGKIVKYSLSDTKGTNCNGKNVKYSVGDMKGTIVQDDSEKYVAANSAVLCADSLVSPENLKMKIC